MEEIGLVQLHAKYAPSAASRWLNCSASVDFKEESETNEQAKFGTEVHEWLALVKRDELVPPMPKHWNAEQALAAHLCREEWEKHVPECAAFETLLRSNDWPDLFFGTADAIWFNGEEVHIADLKTGLRGVSAVDNMQLACYALLASEHTDFLRSFNTFVTHIIQPRRFYYGKSEYSRAQLVALKERVRIAIEEPPIFNAGPHCEFCPARLFCPDLQGALSEILNKARHNKLWEFKNLTWKT